MDKQFVLILTQGRGKTAFLTDKMTLQDALNEYEEHMRAQFYDPGILHDKYFSLPKIISAELVRLSK